MSRILSSWTIDEGFEIVQLEMEERRRCD